ncbi:MtnX-like HAD-IB family phosphatase [Rhizobium sp. IBUN]|uniref:MtnX-like HAD-IB family phosphatase n=1 Tax=Rhizobium sp. IBUN TaxID=1042326 RepID=UPI0003FAC20B|nr:MtnX-like HAD-IB family phosphatase [Rhizobium sp. IBUN]
MQAFCDFDGTISSEDVTDLVLERFALPQWRDIEKKWVEGHISSAECMRRQIALVRTTISGLNRLLDDVEVDPDFASFKHFCDANGIRLTIVSDGVDYFIKRVLANNGLSDVKVVANRLVIHAEAGPASFSLASPFASPRCEAGAGVCKCAVLDGAGSCFYVGDGRSDFCAVQQTPLVFAKAKLATYCEQNRIPFTAYDNFADVLTAVEAIVKNPSRQPFWMPVTQSA